MNFRRREGHLDKARLQQSFIEDRLLVFVNTEKNLPDFFLVQQDQLSWIAATALVTSRLKQR